MSPNDETDNTDSSHSEDHRLVTEDGTSCTRCENFGDNTESRNDNNVHFRMAEEPEQVLEQQRIASARKERRTYRMVKHQEGNTDDQCW